MAAPTAAPTNDLRNILVLPKGETAGAVPIRLFYPG
jgi:hypothetical protein